MVPVPLQAQSQGTHSPGRKLSGGARRHSPPAQGGGPGSSSRDNAPRAGGGSGRRGRGAAAGGTGPPRSSGRVRGAGERRTSRRSPVCTPAPPASPAACSKGAAPDSTRRRARQSRGGRVRGGRRAGPRRSDGCPGAPDQGAGGQRDHPPWACCDGAAPAGCSPRRTGDGQRRAAGQPRRCPAAGSWKLPEPGRSPPAHQGWASAAAAACAPGTSASGPGLSAPPARGTGALWGRAAGQGWGRPGPPSGQGSCRPHSVQG